MKLNHIFTTLSLLTAATVWTACNDDVENFDNQVYVQPLDKTATVLLKSTVPAADASFLVAMAKPMEQDVNVTLKADPSKVSVYNTFYHSDAEALPDGHFKLNVAEVSIKAGGVTSDEVSVSFSGLNELDSEKMYVLPVTIEKASIGILQSASTMYYIFKGAALINTVPDLTKNLVYVTWSNPDVANNLRQLTAEALVRVNKFGKMLTSVMGIEGYFLIRIGDAGIPENQLQLATRNGNLSSSDLIIPTNEWTHIAVTYDADAGGKVVIYLNGKNVFEGNKDCGAINWAQTRSDEGNGFWIGHSYNRDRWLEGNLCECRVWNRVLSKEEINAKDHFYEVDSASEGLVSYWRFNEGAGTAIQDHTGNGNNATAVESLTWQAVELPAKQ